MKPLAEVFQQGVCSVRVAYCSSSLTFSATDALVLVSLSTVPSIFELAVHRLVQVVAFHALAQPLEHAALNFIPDLRRQSRRPFDVHQRRVAADRVVGHAGHIGRRLVCATKALKP